MEVRTGVPGTAGKPGMSELIRTEPNHPPDSVNIQFAILSRLSLFSLVLSVQ